MLISYWLAKWGEGSAPSFRGCRRSPRSKQRNRRKHGQPAVIAACVEILESRILLSPGDRPYSPPVQPSGNAIPESTRVFRAYNPNADYHFFTTSEAEFDNAVAHGYQDERTGQAGFAIPTTQSGQTATVFRLYNLQTGRHYYTFNAAERDFLVSLVPAPPSGPDTRTTGWRYEKDEGFIHTSQLSGTTEIFRLYNNNSGVHLYTENAAYKDAVLNQFPGIWVQHSSLGFAYPIAATTAPQAPTANNVAGTTINPRPTFNWNTVAGAGHYDVWVDNVTANQWPVLRNSQVTGLSWLASMSLNPGDNYRWRVRAVTNGNLGHWSPPRDFSVVAAPPLSLITVSGATFDPALETHVVFTDSTGRQTSVFTTNVTNTQVEVAVPPADDPVTFEFKPETYTVSVVQQTLQGPTNSGPLMILQVTDFSEIPGTPPGKVISDYLEQTIAMVDVVIADYQDIATASGGTVNVTALVNGLQAQRQELTSSLQLIKPLVDGTVQQVNLGTVSGRNVVLIRGTTSASVMPAFSSDAVVISLKTLDEVTVPLLGTGAPNTIQSGGIPGPGVPPPSPVEILADDWKDFFTGSLATELERIGSEGQESAEKVSGLLGKIGFESGIDPWFSSTYTRIIANILRGQWNNLEDPETAEIEVKKSLAEQLFDELGQAGLGKLGELAEEQFNGLLDEVSDNSVIKDLLNKKIGGVQGLVDVVVAGTGILKNQFLQNFNQIVTGLQNVVRPKPVMNVSPAGLTFTATENGPAPGAKQFNVSNTGPAASQLHFNISTGIGRLQISGVQPAAVPGGQSATFSVSVNTSGLAAGTNRQEVITVTNLDTNTTQTVTVSYTITAATNPFAGSYTGNFSGNGTAFGFPFPTSGGVAFTVSAAGVINITNPSGGGSGNVSSTGNANFGGAGGFGSSGDANYSFTGTFIASPAGGVTVSGNWSSTFTGGSAGGGWTANRTSTAPAISAPAVMSASLAEVVAVPSSRDVDDRALDDFFETFGSDDLTSLN